MNSLENLKTFISNDESVKRFKYLENIINNDNKLIEGMKNIKQVQKRLVNAQVNNDKKVESIQEEYESLLKDIVNSAVITEYLDLISVINDNLHLIKNIIINDLDLKTT